MHAAAHKRYAVTSLHVIVVCGLACVFACGCGAPNHAERAASESSAGEAGASADGTLTEQPSIELDCAADCSDPVFGRDVLSTSGALCGDDPERMLRNLETWYLRLEQEAWSTFHDPSASQTRTDRREFLETYVEHPVPILQYGLTKLELADELALAALSALVNSGSRAEASYQRWIDRASREGSRSVKLERCIDALQFEFATAE